MNEIAPYAKAVTAALVAGLSALAGALSDGSLGWEEIITALIATLVASLAVWRVPNKPQPDEEPA